MAELADAGKINVGVRFDQPGLGFKGGTDDIPAGFDVEMAKLLVADLCIDPEDTDAVNYEETISDNRELYLQDGSGRPGRGVVLDHRRSPRARRSGGALLPHRPTGAGEVRQRRRVDRGPEGSRKSARPPARPRSRTSLPPAPSACLPTPTASAPSRWPTARCRRCRPTGRSCSVSPPSTTASSRWSVRSSPRSGSASATEGRARDVRVDQRRPPGGVRRRQVGRGVRSNARRVRAPRRPSRRLWTPAPEPPDPDCRRGGLRAAPARQVSHDAERRDRWTPSPTTIN